MARITQKEILSHFFETFDGDKVRTSSEYKQQAFRLKNLKKVVKEYIEEAWIKTDKSVEKIILEAITFAGMQGRKFTSIASIGYDVLPKSIAYWAKMEEVTKQLEEKAKQKEKEESLATELEQKAIENNKQLQQTKKVPLWFMDDEE